MTRRSYDQYCGLAGALDLVGERWTLLIVRELMTGPKRYTDLADALRGIGTSLLAQRLAKLEADGILVRGRMAAPAASMVYKLTETGEELGRALMPLVLWGLRHAVPEEPAEGVQVRAEWSLLAFTHSADPATLAGIEATFEFVVDGTSAMLRIEGGRASVVQADGSTEPDATIRIKASTVAAVGSGRMSVIEATAAGRVEIEGDPEAVEALIVAFGSTL
ncbi:MAG: winged helix-turn-helix transcriptional regulator [Propionibacteriales bacterium]|nr:winged helix-turn-helix transcriptional regulator [Propionibacteriales bacterium]